MADEIPHDLISSVRDGRTALMLGAGASFGATNSAGAKIPLANELAQKLAAEFLGPGYEGLSFREIYDYSCNQRDVPSVQKFIHDQLVGFNPAEFHKKIPDFSWAGLLTTNYDLIVERAYAAADKSAVQRLVPHVKDRDGAADDIDTKSVLYVKLHGCITRYTETEPPMIASTEQLISSGDGRKGQFDTFLELAMSKNIVFVGYAFGDSNLRQMLDAVVKELDRRPRHFIVDPFMLPAAADYWRDRRFIPIKMDFKTFLETLDAAIPSSTRKLATLRAELSSASTFSRFITTSGREETGELKQYLKLGIDHIHEGYETPNEDKKKFYKGFDLGWQPFAENLDIERKVSDNIISDQILVSLSANTQRFIILKGHAGSGKSVSLRRACWDAANDYDKICFYVSRSHQIKPELFEEMFSLTNLPIYLFVDGVSFHRNKILELLSVAKSVRSTLIVIGSETFNTWNTSCDELERIVFAEYEMRPLSDSEADALIAKLEEHESLGTLSRIPKSERPAQFMVSYGRQILVALLEATNGIPLVEIISREYHSITPPDAKLLYLDICSLHRFGPPVRAGLISRIHNITFEEFGDKLFRPLEQIVHLRQEKSGDYVYEARHPQIATALYDAVLTSQEERFENIVRVITKLNPSYSYDLEALTKILRAENIHNTINTPAKARHIYDIAFDHVGELPQLLHQRGIYEMRVANSLGGLEAASAYLEKALQKETWSKTIKHSLAELDLRRSRLSRDSLERLTWRRAAIQRASDLTLGDTSPYPYHTILKAYTDDVKDALHAVEQKETEANVQHLGECIGRAEDTLKRSLNIFGSDQTLLASEGELADVLSNSGRAETAFRKAFNSNPRSTLVAKRLVKILRAKGDHDTCISVLLKAIEHNPANAELHFDLAKIYMERQPDGDQKESDAILHHLRRSFVSGDRNYTQQFWYARQLCISGRYPEAKEIFGKLEDVDLPFATKERLVGLVRDASGDSRRFGGAMIKFRSSFGFARCNDPQLELFVPGRELDERSGRTFIDGTPITFEIAFNFKGPVAVRVRHITDS